MWENTVVIHSILKKKKLQSGIFYQLNIKKVKSTKIILKKNKWKKGGKLEKKMKKCNKKNKKVKKKKRNTLWISVVSALDVGEQ